MNTLILARILARVDKSGVHQEYRRKLASELASPEPEIGRAKLLATTFMVPILASATVLSPGTGEAANAAGDGALLGPAGNLTQVAAAQVGRTTHHDTFGAIKTKAHGPLMASRHKAWSSNRAG
jgi:hypothetical protein